MWIRSCTLLISLMYLLYETGSRGGSSALYLPYRFPSSSHLCPIVLSHKMNTVLFEKMNTDICCISVDEHIDEHCPFLCKISEYEHCPVMYFRRRTLYWVVFQKANTVLDGISEDEHCPVFYFRWWTLSCAVLQEDAQCHVVYFRRWTLACVVF